MKKITKEEFESTYGSRGSSNLVLKEILNLSIGEAVVVERADWILKTDLAAYVGQIKRRHNGMNWTVRKNGQEGWAVQRIS